MLAVSSIETVSDEKLKSHISCDKQKRLYSIHSHLQKTSVFVITIQWGMFEVKLLSCSSIFFRIKDEGGLGVCRSYSQGWAKVTSCIRIGSYCHNWPFHHHHCSRNCIWSSSDEQNRQPVSADQHPVSTDQQPVSTDQQPICKD